VSSNLTYEVECELDPDIVADYDAWLPGHVQDVLACKGFLGATIEAPEAPPGERQRRIIRYELENAAALDHYLENEATRLRTETAERFGARVHCKRRPLRPRHDLYPAARAPLTCLDCGAPVTGAHCAQCGQAAATHVLSMKEVLGDVTHSLLHLDSRVWRTLRLLARRPGELTREFIAGRHQRYLPPFRLYLAISIIFFALSALLPDGDPVPGKPPEELARELAAEGLSPGEIEQVKVGVPCTFEISSDERFFEFFDAMQRACLKMKEDGGRQFWDRFLSTAPRLMFLFLPLMAAVALLFYWRPRRLYAEHLVLFLHNHALTFLVLTATQIVSSIVLIPVPLIGLLEFLNFLLFLYLAWYMFRSMRVVYAEGRFKTTLKFLALFLIYFTLLGVTMLAGLVWSMLQLA
jgi:hypothetical protein